MQKSRLDNRPTDVFIRGPLVLQMGHWGPQVSQKWALSDLYVLKDTRPPPRFNTVTLYKKLPKGLKGTHISLNLHCSTLTARHGRARHSRARCKVEQESPTQSTTQHAQCRSHRKATVFTATTQ